MTLPQELSPRLRLDMLPQEACHAAQRIRAAIMDFDLEDIAHGIATALPKRYPLPFEGMSSAIALRGFAAWCENQPALQEDGKTLNSYLRSVDDHVFLRLLIEYTQQTGPGLTRTAYALSPIQAVILLLRALSAKAKTAADAPLPLAA